MGGVPLETDPRAREGQEEVRADSGKVKVAEGKDR